MQLLGDQQRCALSVRYRSEIGRVHPNNRPNWSDSDPTLAELVRTCINCSIDVGPSSVKGRSEPFGPRNPSVILLAELRPNPVQHRSNSAQNRSTLADSGARSAKFVRFRPGISRNWPKFGRLRDNPGRLRSTSLQTRPNLARRRALSAEFGAGSTKFGRGQPGRSDLG